METLRQDLRFAGRILKKNSGFTLVAVLTIALGIGATSGILALVNAVLIRPVPFPDPDRVVLVWETQPKQNNRTRLATLADFLDWRDRNHSSESSQPLVDRSWRMRNILDTIKSSC